MGAALASPGSAKCVCVGLIPMMGDKILHQFGMRAGQSLPVPVEHREFHLGRAAHLGAQLVGRFDPHCPLRVGLQRGDYLLLGARRGQAIPKIPNRSIPAIPSAVVTIQPARKAAN